MLLCVCGVVGSVKFIVCFMLLVDVICYFELVDL